MGKAPSLGERENVSGEEKQKDFRWAVSSFTFISMFVLSVVLLHKACFVTSNDALKHPGPVCVCVCVCLTCGDVTGECCRQAQRVVRLD